MKKKALIIAIILALVGAFALPASAEGISIEIVYGNALSVSGLSSGGQVALYIFENNEDILVNVYPTTGPYLSIDLEKAFEITGPVVETSVVLRCVFFEDGEVPIASNTVIYTFGVPLETIPVYNPSVSTVVTLPGVIEYEPDYSNTSDIRTVVSLMSQLQKSSIWSLVIEGVAVFTSFALFGFVLNKLS